MIPNEACGAWRELETRLRPYVERRIASAADADDVLQDVFTRIQRGLAELRDGERFGAWVYGIARRAVADYLRARSRTPLVLEQDAEHVAPNDDEPGLEGELVECVALFVSRLPSPYRQAITLTELEGLTQKAAADMLGISLSGMKSRVQRGRAKIRGMFDECCTISVDCRGRVVQCDPRAIQDIPEDCRAAAAEWAARRT